MANRQHRLSSWRSEVGLSERANPAHTIRGHLSAQHSLLRGLLLDCISELDRTHYELDAFFAQGERSALHVLWLNERAGQVLRVYEHNVARLVEKTMGRVYLIERPFEAVKIIYRDPPRPVPWYHRLFGG